jgi:hypothetical protein
MVLKLIVAILSQALRDLDFEVRDKMAVESILDIEFQDPSISDKAIFYTGKTKLLLKKISLTC